MRPRTSPAIPCASWAGGSSADARVTSPLAGAPPAPTPRELYRGFFLAGARGFGGTLPWARRMLVEERRWLTEQEFLDTFSLCNLLPGPNVASMAVILGARFRGLRGALAALGGLLTIPLATILTLAVLFERFGQLP